MEQEKVVVEMTKEEADELARLRADRAAQEAANQRRADRDAYRKLTQEFVAKYAPRLLELSEAMQQIKTEVFRDSQDLIEMKRRLAEVKDGQRSHTWMSEDSSCRITVGNHKRDTWDDLADVGVSKIKNYLSSLAESEKERQLVDVILGLLSQDKQGNLRADKVLQLKQYTEQIEDPEFREGVRILTESYRPELSKQYIRVEVKDEAGAWNMIPLSVTEVTALLEVATATPANSEKTIKE